MNKANDNPKILIVDDDKNSRTAVRSVLETMDTDIPLNIVEASSGEQALRTVLENDFAMIILDVRMKGIDGFETANIIRDRENSKDIPIIFLSGADHDAMLISRGYEMGTIDFMLKPVNAVALSAKVKYHIRLVHAQKLERNLERERALERERELKHERDLERERAHSRELSVLIKELERSNRDLDEFAYIASHDLKEPLRGIGINANFLLREKLSVAAQKRVARMGELSGRMEQLISDLLFFSRLGRSDSARIEVSPTHAIQAIRADLAEWLSENNAKIVVRGKLPGVLAERLKLKVVLQNLITNAVKYNNSKEKTVEIGFMDSAVVQEQSMSNVIYVKDNGIGISDAHHEKVFRIFSRLNEKEIYDSGSGLAFVRKIIEEHGGEVNFNSEVGTGSTFYFTLPLAWSDDTNAKSNEGE
ncbi:MAG: response regulator [Sulfitobacter sp.]